MSPLLLNVGCINSIPPPKAIAPQNTIGNLKRPVKEKGNTSTRKAKKWKNLSVPFGAENGF